VRDNKFAFNGNCIAAGSAASSITDMLVGKRLAPDQNT
jgi:hypothetical protein